MQIKILGAHNTESRDSRLAGLLIDDILALDAGSLTSSLSFEEQLRLKAVLLSHHHYDHVRDLPALGMTLYLKSSSLDIYCLSHTIEALSACFFNGMICKDFTRQPEGKPVFRFIPVSPGVGLEVRGYHITPVNMPHSVPSAGYSITSPNGERLFYTGDTGAGFAGNIAHISPQLLIVEVTAPNRFTAFGHSNKHLSPMLLEAELSAYKKVAGCIPRVIAVHLHAPFEEELKEEMSQVASRLKANISPAHEGMVITL